MQHLYLLTPAALINDRVCFVGLDSKSDALGLSSPLPVSSLASQAVSGRHVVLNTAYCPLGAVLEIGGGIFDGHPEVEGGGGGRVLASRGQEPGTQPAHGTAALVGKLSLAPPTIHVSENLLMRVRA